MGPFNKYVTVEGEGWGSWDPWQTVTEISGEGGSGFTRYVTVKYKIFTIISRKLQCISNTFLQNTVKISKCNLNCKLIHIYTVIILTLTYACSLLKVRDEPHLDSRSRISYWNRYVTEGIRGEARLIYRYEAWHRGGWGLKKTVF